ncbi:MAG TPA: sigma 54-interacting transcriptional regulator [Vicinamibacterales bacterium]|nr:sigma 54-interacting transcriptional regulator [Vicinamibacterales bacterium]
MRHELFIAQDGGVMTTDADTPLALVGASDSARTARAALADACARRGPVLLIAEAGCRAEDVVEALHSRTRAGRPLVWVDCGASDPADIDVRLFGAVAPRAGAHDLETIGSDAAILDASDGTLVLDNIDGLPASSQRRLARVLRDGEVRVPGAALPCVAGFRLVGATARDLDEEANEGRFREDLLRRFAARITVPPLRQRSQDIPEIVERLARDAGREAMTFTSAAINVLAALPWTRNVDELGAVLGRILAGMATAVPDAVRQEDVLLNLPIPGGFARPDLTASLREARRRFEREYIAAVLERHQWRMSDAARTLGIERANLYRKTRQLGIARATRGELAAVTR